MFENLAFLFAGMLFGAWGLKTYAVYKVRSKAKLIKAQMDDLIKRHEAILVENRERTDLVINTLLRAGQNENEMLALMLVQFFTTYEDKNKRFPTATELDGALKQIMSASVEPTVQGSYNA